MQSALQYEYEIQSKIDKICEDIVIRTMTDMLR